MMEHRFSRHVFCLLACILLFTCSFASAQGKTWTLKANALNYEMTTFDGELPKVLADAAAKTRWADYACVKGIRQDEIVRKTGKLKFGTALAVMEKDGQTVLLQFVCKDKKTWQIFPAGEGSALLTGREYSFDAVLVRTYPRVEIVYPCQDGGREVFRIVLPPAQPVTPVYVEHYRREYQDGSSLTIGSGARSSPFFTVKTTSAADVETVAYEGPCLYPTWLEALNADAFPKTQDDVLRLMESVLKTPPEGYGLLAGVNLREKATAGSEKLGVYRPGTLAKILGTEQGKTDPWYKVQVGQTVGYVSGPYMYTAENERTPLMYNAQPLTVGRTNSECELKEKPASNGKTAQTLKAGTVMYVLADCGEWLHVCIPRGELGYFMDVEGTFGYLRVKDVTQAATPLQLKYTGD